MPPDSRADPRPGKPRAKDCSTVWGDAECVPPALCVGGLGLPRAFGRHSAGRRTRGASASRGGSAGTPQAAVHAGHRPSRGFRDPCGPPYTRGIGPRRRSPGLPQAAAHAGHRSLQAFRRPPAGRRHARDIGPSRAFRGPPYTRGLGPRGHSAGLPQAAAMRGTSAPRGRSAGRRTRGASALAGVPQASRRTPPHAGPRPLAGIPRPMRPAARRGASATRGRSATHAGLHHTRGIGPRGLRRPRRRSPRLPPPAPALNPPAARFSRKPPCGIGSRMVYCT